MHHEGKSGKLVTTILRTGKRPSGKEITMILKRIVKRIRKAWPDVGIIVRGDSYYSCPEVFDFCDENDLKFVLGLTVREPIEEKARTLSQKAEEFYGLKNKPFKLLGECFYQAGSWTKHERIIYKAEHNDKDPNVRAIVTNLENSNRRMIYETIYCGRGAMELMIKEHKNHLRSDKTSCNSFLANQFRLFIHSMAYVLLHAFREICLRNTQFAKVQFDTIRLKILKLGARVIHLSTKVKVHLPTSCPYQEDLFRIWQICVT
ncbi:IS1380 family transposase [bacterium]|nr:IS1380 family transposase [bacterium]